MSWWGNNFRLRVGHGKTRALTKLMFKIHVGGQEHWLSTNLTSTRERNLLKKILAFRARGDGIANNSPESSQRVVNLITRIAYISRGHKYHRDHPTFVKRINHLLKETDKELVKSVLD